jgi:hypothetical protein
MKRTALTLVAVLVTLGLVACEPTDKHVAGQEQQPSAAAPTTITVSSVATAKAAPVRPGLSLTLSGGLKGHATAALNQKPIKTGAHYDYNPGDGTTQCVMPADDGAWTAQMTFTAAGVTWELNLNNGNTFGSPKAGRHPLEDKSSIDGNTIGINLGSDKSPDGIVGTSGVPFGYTFRMADDHNWRGTVILDSGLQSGTIDAWIVPSEPGDNLEFHLSGTWRCA